MLQAYCPQFNSRNVFLPEIKTGSIFLDPNWYQVLLNTFITHQGFQNGMKKMGLEVFVIKRLKQTETAQR